LAVLASWNSIDFDLRRGDMTITRKLDGQLACALSAQPDRFERQRMIIEWFFRQYEQYFADDQLIRYETLIESPTSTLRRIIPNAPIVDVPLFNKSANRAYNRRLTRQLATLLIDRPSVILRYYTREQIVQLRDQIVG
jgi:hypothetical protein